MSDEAGEWEGKSGMSPNSIDDVLARSVLGVVGSAVTGWNWNPRGELSLHPVMARPVPINLTSLCSLPSIDVNPREWIKVHIYRVVHS